MEQNLQTVIDLVNNNPHLSDDEKEVMISNLKETAKNIATTESKLDRTEKEKKKTATLLEETIEELQQKRKAIEEKNRELEIENALEKVRAIALSMKEPRDMLDVCNTIAQQLELLNVKEIRNVQTAIFYEDKGTYINYEFYAKHNKLLTTEVDFKNHDIQRKFADQMLKGAEEFFTLTIEGQELKDWYAFQKTTNQFPDTYLETASSLTYYWFSLGPVALGISTYEPLSNDEINLFKRFRNVFELSYRRYLDIEKAEAQARQAKIEAALERVRAKAVGMRQSDELSEVLSVLFQQYDLLGMHAIVADMNLFDIPNNKFTHISTGKGGKRIITQQVLDIDASEMWLNAVEEWKKNKSQSISYVYYPVEYLPTLFEIFHDMHSALPEEDMVQQEDFPQGMFQTSVNCQFGNFGILQAREATDEEKKLLSRFAKEFERLYQRFLDLQKAETNAREATIEAALERVRGLAMAMHNSKDLSSAASMVFTELRKLGINPIRCGVGLLTTESRKAQLYSATSSTAGDNLSLVGWVMLSGHPVLENIYETWLKNEDYFPVLNGKELTSYYEQLLSGLSVPPVQESKIEETQYGHFIPLSIGCLYAWADIHYNDPQIKILKRFATIIDLTFRRYVELQKSEANAREAIKQAALDRVRAEIASMRTVTDLEKITPLIWNELIILGVPFIRCGVFIMDDPQQVIHTFLSTPNGKAIAAFHLPYTTPGNIELVLEHWREKKNYIDHWDETEFTEFAALLKEQEGLSSSEHYLETFPAGGFYLHFIPFFQGMLYVGNTNQLNEDEIKLIQSVADAFSTAYARYEDFNKLEAAKQQVDKTLVDLKQAQQQLVQSEKMASLGELTAGIAHEIQNPLNFVNNFSEVNTELIEDMKAELSAGNHPEAILIADDIKENAGKINFHGKRADAIVKGMLQHSRKTTGEKELTDINAVADEFLRLSYHGLRAKDKSFNATMETHFDPALEKINVIAQDIGRVLLNLFNNAFYAVNGKKKLNIAGYEPLVTVRTKKAANKILISVQDNGNGIPEKELDKIFQPFFTTKPTGQGTGLGLSLSYDIIKAHGGEIKVETKDGEGAEFIIYLPVT